MAFHMINRLVIFRECFAVVETVSSNAFLLNLASIADVSFPFSRQAEPAERQETRDKQTRAPGARFSKDPVT